MRQLVIYNANELSDFAKKKNFSIGKIELAVPFDNLMPTFTAVLNDMLPHRELVLLDELSQNGIKVYSLKYLEVNVGMISVYPSVRHTVITWDQPYFPSAALTQDDWERLASRLTDIEHLTNKARQSPIAQGIKYKISFDAKSFRDELNDGISLEQYLRNLLQSLKDDRYSAEMYIPIVAMANERDPKDTPLLEDFQKKYKSQKNNPTVQAAIHSYQSLYRILVRERSSQAIFQYINQNNSLNTFLFLLFKKLAAESMWENIREVQRPQRGAPLKRWFEYEWHMEQQGNEIFYKDLAEESGYSLEYFGRERREWRKNKK